MAKHKHWFAVFSASGVHIGLWNDGKIAGDVLARDYPDGRILELVELEKDLTAILDRLANVNHFANCSPENIKAILDNHAALVEALETVLASFKHGDDSGSALYIDDDRGELAEMIATALTQAKGEA